MTTSAPTIMLVAAEASGDELGAELAAALKVRRPGVRFVGVGGPRLAAHGIRSPFDITELSILGLLEGLGAYPRVRRRVRDTVALAAAETPDLVVLIDSWGFTLRVAQALRRRWPSLPLIKYVAPQVWASRPGRARTLAQTVDRLLTTHALDAPYFDRVGLPVTFVGSSVLARRFDAADGGRLRQALGAKAEDPVIVVLPGSRPSEIAHLSAPFADALKRLAQARPSLRIVIPVAETVRDAVEAWAATLTGSAHVLSGDAAKADAYAAATVALACSGTVTTELALARVAMVVAYKVSPVTYALYRLIATTRFACLLNIAAQREIVPERLQGACTGANLAEALLARLDDPKLRFDQVREQDRALDLLGRRNAGDPSGRAAEAVLEMLPTSRA